MANCKCPNSRGTAKIVSHEGYLKFLLHDALTATANWKAEEAPIYRPIGHGVWERYLGPQPEEDGSESLTETFLLYVTEAI